MVETDDIKLFEKANESRLTPKENELFTQKLEKNPDFKRNYNRYQNIISAIREQYHYHALKTLLDENYRSRNWAEGAKGLSGKRLLTPIGALLLFLALVAVSATLWLTRGFFTDKDQTKESLNIELEQNGKGSSTEFSNEPATTSTNLIEETETIPESELSEFPVNPTAFMITQEGYFITQYSPIKDARSVRLRHSDSTEHKAEMVIADGVLDLAILRLTDNTWAVNSRLPYRLATTQAFAGTEVVQVSYNPVINHSTGIVASLEAIAGTEFYSIQLNDSGKVYGGPVISRNGNIIAVAIAVDGNFKYVKSTFVVGLLSRNAADLKNYLPAVDNRLAGLERSVQLERIEPFMLEVIRFY